MTALFSIILTTNMIILTTRMIILMVHYMPAYIYPRVPLKYQDTILQSIDTVVDEDICIVLQHKMWQRSLHKASCRVPYKNFRRQKFCFASTMLPRIDRPAAQSRKMRSCGGWTFCVHSGYLTATVSYP